MRLTTGLVALWAISSGLVAAGEAPLRAWVDVPPPRRLPAPPPVYPAIAAQARVQAILVLRVTVGPDGHPAEVKIERGVPLFDEAALRAVRGWRYEATVIDGVPRSVMLYQPILFTLTATVADLIGEWAEGLRSKDRWALDGKMWAVEKLQSLLPTETAAATKRLEKLASDPDERVAGAAKAALANQP